MPITEEQLQVLQDLFHNLDQDGAFSINADELEKAVKNDIPDETLRESALHSISQMDRNDDGSISFVEYVSTLKRDMRVVAEDKPEEKKPEEKPEDQSEEKDSDSSASTSTPTPASSDAAAAAAKTEEAKPESEKKEDDEDGADDPKAAAKALEGPIIKEGPLLKEGEIFKTWKKRHFVLRKGLMTYHEKKGGKLIKSFAFDKAVVGVSSPDVRKKKGNKKNLFEIITKTRTWYLASDSEDETKAWVDALVNQCGCTNRQAVQVTDSNENSEEEQASPKTDKKEKAPEAAKTETPSQETESKGPDAEAPEEATSEEASADSKE